MKMRAKKNLRSKKIQPKANGLITITEAHIKAIEDWNSFYEEEALKYLKEKSKIYEEQVKKLDEEVEEIDWDLEQFKTISRLVTLGVVVGTIILVALIITIIGALK